jgi:hypothetical protein
VPESIGACDRQRLKIKLLPTHKCRAFDADTGARNIAWERVQFKGMTKVFQKGCIPAVASCKTRAGYHFWFWSSRISLRVESQTAQSFRNLRR